MLHKIIKLPNIYAQEIDLAYKHAVHGTALEQLIQTEKEMMKELADLEKQAAIIWRKYEI